MSRRSSISNTDKVIDSRDIIARVAELRSEADDAIEAAKTARERIAEIEKEKLEIDDDDAAEEALEEEAAELEASIWKAEDGTELTDAMDEDDYTELKALEALTEEAESATSEWHDGATLIHADYFADYAKELAEDIGAIDRDAEWPLNHIDWEAAADELLQDYSTVDFDGQDYYVRDC